MARSKKGKEYDDQLFSEKIVAYGEETSSGSGDRVEVFGLAALEEAEKAEKLEAGAEPAELAEDATRENAWQTVEGESESLSASRSRPPLKGMIETVLFVTNKPLQIMEIGEIVGADDFEVEEALMELMNDYTFREGALEIDDADGYILQVREDFQPILDKMMPMELTPGALRTLSAIAIKAPVLQSDLVEMRGSQVYDHIPELLAKKLVTKKREGRSYRLNVTKSFFEYFKLVGDKKELQVLVSLLGNDKAEGSGTHAPDDEMPTPGDEDETLAG